MNYTFNVNNLYLTLELSPEDLQQIGMDKKDQTSEADNSKTKKPNTGKSNSVILYSCSPYTTKMTYILLIIQETSKLKAEQLFIMLH